jgi:DNA 3'-phosphatase
MAKNNKSTGTWSWLEQDTCLYGSSEHLKASNKIASFDMDDTIITRKSGAKFPKDANDWILLNNKVAPKIKELFNDAYKIVIFTNQAGI